MAIGGRSSGLRDAGAGRKAHERTGPGPAQLERGGPRSEFPCGRGRYHDLLWRNYLETCGESRADPERVPLGVVRDFPARIEDFRELATRLQLETPAPAQQLDTKTFVRRYPLDSRAAQYPNARPQLVIRTVMDGWRGPTTRRIRTSVGSTPT